MDGRHRRPWSPATESGVQADSSVAHLVVASPMASERNHRRPSRVRPVMTRLLGLVLPLFVAGCTASPSGASMSPSAAAPPSSSGPAVSDCGSFTLRQGEDMPESAATCFLDAHRAKRAARLERTAPSVEGYPVRDEYVADGTGLIAVTMDMSQDPYGGFRIVRKVCSGAAATATGSLTFTGCKIR